MQRAFLSVLLFLLTCHLAAPASANEMSFTEEMARLHYKAGVRYFDVSNFSEALVEFKKAHALEPKPALLYNMARCHESMGQAEEALRLYRRYLEEMPGAENRTTVELRIENLEKAAAARVAPPPKGPPAAPPVKTEPSAPEPVGATPAVGIDEDGPPSWLRTAGWAAVGTGGALLVTGIVFGALTSGKIGEYDDGLDGSKTYDELNEIADQGRTYEKVQLGTFITGALLAAAGGGVLLWSYLRGGERETPEVSVAPYGSATGGGVFLSAPLPEVLP